MKSFLLLFASFCFAVSLHAREVVYPQLRTVIDKLFNSYDVPETRAESNLHFAKKPEGWFVQWTDQTTTPEKVKSEELFWSAAKSKFVKLSMKPGKTAIANDMKSSMYNESQTYSFTRCAYWGYIGWDKDVIRNFAGKTNLTDTLLEGLARAYTNLAFGYTDHPFGFHNSSAGLDSKTKLDSFVYYQQLCIATYDRLRKQNPDHDMLAGSAHTKYSGEIMAFYDYLLISGQEAIAKPYFNESLFDTIILASARAMLSACGTNGILFTNGDNDTFPLEYLQAVRGFRTDVTVMNISMMALSSTLAQASRGKGKALPVKFSYGMENYSNDASQYFRREISEPTTSTFNAFLSKIEKQPGDFDGPEDDYFSYPTCSLEVRSSTASFKNFENPASDSIAFIPLTYQTYLYRSDFAQLDIILSNYKTRPVYFAITTGQLNLDIEKYLFNVGMIRQFIPLQMRHGNIKSEFGENFLQEEAYSNLMKINFVAAPVLDKENDYRFVANFKIQFILLAHALTSENPEKAIRLLDHCDLLFPSSQWKYDPIWAYGVQAYYECRQKEKGDKIAFKMCDEFEKQLADKKNPPGADDRNNMRASLKIIRYSALEFKRVEVADRAEVLMVRLTE